ncbi:MAG: rhomboid family intramembrane serine protease [Bacteroidia bacterium]|nr:rhomboid family intramembrane serine protease [Bacteroidia bacterium]
MRTSLQEIKMQFGGASALYRLLALNIGLFLLITIARTIFFLAGADTLQFEYYISKLSLPASLNELLYQPWAILTYMFLHVDILHILFNMLVLYWTGKLFTEYLGNEKLWATYVLGALSGAAVYLLAFNLFPAFDGKVASSHLLGASAGVIAVLVAIATLLPDYTVHLLIFGAVRLKYIALISILLYFISIPLGNAGGHIAHLGGAVFGFLMVRQLRNGRDLTGWLTAIGRKRTGGKTHLKVVRRGRTAGDDGYSNDSISHQELIDKILDKINKSGFDSLTKEEKQILYKASGNQDNP